MDEETSIVFHTIPAKMFTYRFLFWGPNYRISKIYLPVSFPEGVIFQSGKKMSETGFIPGVPFFSQVKILYLFMFWIFLLVKIAQYNTHSAHTIHNTQPHTAYKTHNTSARHITSHHITWHHTTWHHMHSHIEHITPHYIHNTPHSTTAQTR